MVYLADRVECEREELIEAIAEGVTSIKESVNRVTNIWTLKVMAENIARLDEIDRVEGFLPLEVRPPLMMRCDEAALVVRALVADVPAQSCEASAKVVSLVQKLNGYLCRA